MGRSRTVIRAVTSAYTRSDTLATLSALGASILALFTTGGGYDLGVNRAWVQWAGSSLEVVLEADTMSAVAASLSTRNTTIIDGLDTLSLTATGANIETLEQSALSVLPTVAIGVTYAADSWDEHWEDPTSLPSGWAVDTTGADPDTAASYPAAGTGTAIQLDSDANGKALITKTFSGLTTETTWEVRAEIKTADIGTTVASMALNLWDGTRTLQFRPRTTGLGYYNGSTLTAAPVTHTVAAGDWLVYTVRRVGDVVYAWIGPDLVFVGLYTAFASSASNGGQIWLGNSDTAAKTATIRRFSIKLGAVNAASPMYTMRGTRHGR